MLTQLKYNCPRYDPLELTIEPTYFPERVVLLLTYPRDSAGVPRRNANLNRAYSRRVIKTKNGTTAKTDTENRDIPYYDRLRAVIRLPFPGLFAAPLALFPPFDDDDDDDDFFPRPAPPASKLSVDDFVFCFDHFLGPPNPNFWSRACRGIFFPAGPAPFARFEG